VKNSSSIFLLSRLDFAPQLTIAAGPHPRPGAAAPTTMIRPSIAQRSPAVGGRRSCPTRKARNSTPGATARR